MSIQTFNDIKEKDWEILENGKILQLNYNTNEDPPFEDWNLNCECITWNYDPDSSCQAGYVIKPKFHANKTYAPNNGYSLDPVNRLGQVQGFEEFTIYKKRSKGNIKDCPIVTNYVPCKMDCKVSDWKQPLEDRNCRLERDGYKYKRAIREIISREQGGGAACPPSSDLLGPKIRCEGGPFDVSNYKEPCESPPFLFLNPEVCSEYYGGNFSVVCNEPSAKITFRDTFCKEQFKDSCKSSMFYACQMLNTCANGLGLTTQQLEQQHGIVCINGQPYRSAEDETPINPNQYGHIRTNKLSFYDMFIRDNRGNYKNLY